MLASSIENGIVIDHITAGNGIKIIEYLRLREHKYTVVFLMNAESKERGSKDIIKINNVTKIDLDALGLIDPEATVNIIENHKITNKIHLKLPSKVTNVIKCKNPRCVTSIEAIDNVFHLVDLNQRTYRCEYCDDLINTEKWIKHKK